MKRHNTLFLYQFLSLLSLIGFLSWIHASSTPPSPPVISPLSTAPVEDLFKIFMQTHKKVYSSEKHADERFEIFKQNIEKSRLMNVMEGKQVYGVTKFSDLTEEEFKSRILMKPKKVKEIEGDLQMMKRMGPSSQQVRDMPENVDWDKIGAVTGVKNQGQCGSCWSFSTTGVLEAAYYFKHQKLMALSEQQLVDCDHNCVMFQNQKSCDQGCDGGLPWSAYQYIQLAGGIEFERDYEYVAYNEHCKANPQKFISQVSNWTMLTTNETELAAYIAEHGPVSVALNAGFLQSYTQGIADPPFCDPTNLDHAVLIVGYGMKKFWFGKPEPYWLVKNSWGYDWGENGYFYLIRGKGACGINTVPSIAFLK